MLKRLIPALCLCLAVVPAWSQSETGIASVAQPPARADSEAPEFAPQVIEVTGVRAGPPLWKISKGDHVLWVFGTYSPLPKNMQWRSKQAETILASAQEYLAAPSSSVQLGFFKSLTVIPFALTVKKNPDGADLREVVPADVYARWLTLKEKYIGNDDLVERERPIFAAAELYRKGLGHSGLTSSTEVTKTIEDIVKKRGIKTTSSNIEFPVDSPVKMIKDFKKSSMNDVACFSKTLDRLETDIDAMRVRARAWAKGDVDVIRKLDFADREEACSAALFESEFAKNQPGFQSIKTHMRDKWLASAEKSLATNATTFAILKLQDILSPTGYVAALKAKGYLVEAP